LIKFGDVAYAEMLKEIKQRRQILMLSIIPDFVKQIEAGIKKIEFRKSRPKKVVDYCLIYSIFEGNAPIIAKIYVHKPESVENVLKRAEQENCKHRFLNSYFSGKTKGIMIDLLKIYEINLPISEMRKIGIKPPLGIGYVYRKQIQDIIDYIFITKKIKENCEKKTKQKKTEQKRR